MVLLKVPHSDDNDAPMGWYIIGVERYPDKPNQHTIKWINSKWQHTHPNAYAWPLLKEVVPDYESIPMDTLINHPNLVRLDSLKGNWIITAHYCYGSGYESQEPVKVWKVDNVETAVLLIKALEKCAEEALKEDETQEYNFHLSKLSPFKSVEDSVSEMKDYMRPNFE